MPIPFPPPPAVPSPDPIAIALALAARCQEAVKDIRRDGPAWEDLVRETALEDLRRRYPGISPLPWPGDWEDYKSYNDGGLHDLHLKICESVRLHRTVPPMVATHQQLASEATTAIRAALVQVTTRARPNLRTAGASRMMTTRPPAENALDDAQEQVDVLNRALEEIAAELPRLIEATPKFAVTGLQVLREGRIAACSLYIERQRRELAKLRIYPAEREAAAAVALLSDQVIPELHWNPDDLLEPPTLQ